jgi:hypothetical protein
MDERLCLILGNRLRPEGSHQIYLNYLSKYAGADEPDPQKYPRFLVYLSEGRCQLEIESKLPAVFDISERDGWFKPTEARGKEQQLGLTGEHSTANV